MREIQIVYLETHGELTAITRQSEKITCDMNGDVYVFRAGDNAWTVAVASDRFVTYTARELPGQSDRPAGTSTPKTR